MSSQTVRFQVEGMNCASCVGRVERALRKVDGAQDVRVNLASETVEAAFDPPAMGRDFLNAAEKAGYPPVLGEAVFDIEGMTCAACSGRIQRMLNNHPAVVSAHVNLAGEDARIQFLGDADVIAARITKMGYPTQLRTKDSAPKPTKAEEADALHTQALIAAVLTLPVFVAEMGGHAVPAFHHWLYGFVGQQPVWIAEWILVSLVLGFPGRVFFKKGFPALFKGAPDMNALVAVGTSAAYLYSVVATFAPALLPEAARAVYFEAAGVIVTLILAGRMMEARAKGRSGAAVRGLIALRPRSARVLVDGVAEERDIALISAGDLIQLRPGERVSVDGVVVEGESHVDESMLTGEPIPVSKSAGDAVTGGTMNTNGALIFKATHVGADTVLAQVIKMVESAQAARLPIQAMVDRVTLWFVPVVMGIAVLTVLIWLVLGGGVDHALVAGVSVLIIACPCAMGLATPTSIMVGTGRAAQLGVLFHKGDALQGLQGAKVVALDKTGTLTKGHPELTDIETIKGVSRAEALRLAAALEAGSEHPIARAIVAAYEGDLPKVIAFEAVTGMGVKAFVDGQPILLGAARFLTSEGVEPSPLSASAQAWASQGRTPIFLAEGGRVIAVMAVSDPIRETTPEAIKALHAQGLEVAMITGDARATAEAVAKPLNIDHVVAQVLPAGKVDAIKTLQSKGAVAFVGDGVNDAPALAQADTGIAIGTGSDVAIEAADVVLMRGDLRALVAAFEISRRTMANIRQNLFWAFGYNVVLIPVAAGALYPAFGWQLSPALAAGAMALSSVFVLTNALRLRFIRA